MHFGWYLPTVLIVALFFTACQGCWPGSEKTENSTVSPEAVSTNAPSTQPASEPVQDVPQGLYPPFHLLPDDITFSFGLTCFHQPASKHANRCEAWNQDLDACQKSLKEKMESDRGSQHNAVQHSWDTAILQGTLLLDNGREREAAAYFKKAYAPAKRLGSKYERFTLRQRGIAELRWGERTNCVENHNAETCLLPIRGGGEHVQRDGSAAAIKTFEKYLDKYPHDETIQWLLNLAYMTLGAHPEGVPSPHRIPPRHFESEVSFPTFKNVAPALGLHQEGLVGGVILDDFNNNGFLDIIVSSIGFCDPIRYYENDGDGNFTDRTIEAGLAEVFGAGHMVQADYNNNGHLDIYTTRGMWERPGRPNELAIPVHNTLLRNQGDGTFEDATQEAGLSTLPHYNVASVWGDFNHSGFVDLFVCAGGNTRSLLYRNENGHFQDVTHASGIDNQSHCLGAAWGDINNNGWPDLFIANHRDQNKLYINQGDGTFEKAPAPNLEHTPHHAFATWFWDYDNDGHLDLFVAAWDGSLDEVPAALKNQVKNAETVHLFRNNGDGTFSDVTKGMGFDSAILAMGANFGDLDNDGFLDVYLGTGAPDFAALMPNRMYRNENGKRFVDITYAGGFGNIQKGHGIAFGDLNNNGYPEVFASMGGWILADRFADSLYANPGGDNRWLILRLEGSETNRSAIGSRVRARITEEGSTRDIHRVVGSGGSFGSNSLQVQLGIGTAAQVDELEIHWAGSSKPTVFSDVAPNRILAVRQGEEKYTVMEASSFSFPEQEKGQNKHHHCPPSARSAAGKPRNALAHPNVKNTYRTPVVGALYRKVARRSSIAV